MLVFSHFRMALLYCMLVVLSPWRNSKKGPKRKKRNGEPRTVRRESIMGTAERRMMRRETIR